MSFEEDKAAIAVESVRNMKLFRKSYQILQIRKSSEILDM